MEGAPWHRSELDHFKWVDCDLHAAFMGTLLAASMSRATLGALPSCLVAAILGAALASTVADAETSGPNGRLVAVWLCAATPTPMRCAELRTFH